MFYKEEFQSHISQCCEEGVTIKLSEILQKKKALIINETTTLNSIEDLKDTWRSRLRMAYDIFKRTDKRESIPEVEFLVEEDIWINLYLKCVENQDQRNQAVAAADREQVTSLLYKNANDAYRDKLINSSKRKADDDDLDDLIPRAPSNRTVTVSTSEFRSLIYKAGYNLLKNQFSLIDLQYINNAITSINPKTLGEHLDHLSYKIINENLNNEAELTLKLSLSRILYLVGGPARNIQEDYFKTNNLQEQLSVALSQKPVFSNGLSNDMSSMFDQIILSSKNGLVPLKIFIARKKIETLSNNGDNTELFELLEIMDYIVSNLPLVKDPKASELTWYRKTAHILDIIFKNTDFLLNDGETCCNATKVARNNNLKLCDDSDTKKPLYGRKIDLLLNTVSMDISSSEWKKSSVPRSSGEQQQVKNCRTNSAILHQVTKLPINELHKNDVSILGMDWIGGFGYMFCIKEVDDAHVAYHLGDLVLPLSVASLPNFKETINLLYVYKHHQIKLKEIVEPAVLQQQASSTLSHYRYGNVDEDDTTPTTIFTPVKKQSARTTPTANSNVDNDF